MLEPTRPMRPIKVLLRDPVDPVRTQAVWRRLRERRESHARPIAAWALATSLAALALWSVAQREHSDARAGSEPEPPVIALSLSDGAAIPAEVITTDTPRALQLSDASSIQLAERSELRTLSSSATAFATELTRGSASFEVTPGGPRRWSVRVGSVEVRVIGTGFRVERVDAEVVVSVAHGVVSVSGATVAGGEQRLRAGQMLRVLAELPKPPAPAPAAPPASAMTTADDAPSLAPVRAPLASVEAPSTVPAAQPAVVQPAALTQPPPAATPTPTVDELLAAADRDRAFGQAARAARELEQVLERYPEDPRAPLAALTLGRLYVQLARPAEGVLAIEQARQLGLPEALAEQAAAYLVLAHARAGHREDAHAAAARYHAAFPAGRWSDSVRQWLGTR